MSKQILILETDECNLNKREGCLFLIKGMKIINKITEHFNTNQVECLIILM